MPCTPAERATISRQNGRRSRGPTSERGKMVSRMNALKHGMRAEKLLMPGEDPEAIAALQRRWDDYYRPASPAAEHLVDLCVRAQLVSDRCFRAHDHAVAGQVEEAHEMFDRARARAIAHQETFFVDDPAAAVAALAETGEGCRAMIGRWERLGGLLEVQGHWTTADCTEALGLLGMLPSPELIGADATFYLVRLCHFRCQPDAVPEAVALIMKHSDRPPGLDPAELASLGDAPACRAWLRRLVDDRLAELGAAEEFLRTGPDAVARSRVTEPCLLIQDELEAKRFFRYFAESRSTFLRCFKELEATRERDARAGSDDRDNRGDRDKRDDRGATAADADRAAGAPAPAAEVTANARFAEAFSPNEPSQGAAGRATAPATRSPGAPGVSVPRDPTVAERSPGAIGHPGPGQVRPLPALGSSWRHD